MCILLEARTISVSFMYGIFPFHLFLFPKTVHGFREVECLPMSLLYMCWFSLLKSNKGNGTNCTGVPSVQPV